ncbi:two-component flavin-dependent monooxygenase/oxygenase LndZ5 [Saccharothrix saharensis]|uniref:Dibenzothiophene monooxygenase n=1 Tax=Saccharothrix saharensis TaxID=571190 RepID=A0A543JQC9_9PSEU|nr:acyl-CoA dehydrogenase family protein [Saccharothrix saharensis]TQM85046.1 two-component flavin-dependent monooxygenase/oxygenase LndZ5 [Saccharothrix saharensis]
MLDHPLTQDSLTTATEEVAAVAARCADRAEADRRLDPDVVRAVLDAGFARHFVPAAWQGRDGDFLDLTRAVAAVGEACASTAWFASLTASLGRMAAFLPVEGQAELWSDGPDALIVGALMPIGRAEPVDGGWRLSGTWSFVSAVDFSDWALVCAMAATGGAPEARFFAVPRAAYRIEDTWHSVGMRGTGSNTLVLEDVFVPATRSFSRDRLAAGRSAGSTAPCHATPLRAANGLSFAAPVLGAARGALAAWTGYIREKTRNAPARDGVAAGTPQTHELTLTRASAEVEAAQLLLERAAGVADRGAVPPDLVARNTRDCAFAVDLLVTAVNRLFRAAGTSGQSSTNAIQRFWRDANAASSHIVLQFEPAAAAYAGRLLADHDTPEGK